MCIALQWCECPAHLYIHCRWSTRHVFRLLMSLSASQVTVVACAAPIVYLTWKIGGHYLYKHFENKSTVLNELKHIGKPRPDSKRIKGTAVICGGRWIFQILYYHLLTYPTCSIAGLWTARALADHYEDVLIIEPEAWIGSEVGRSNAYTADGIPIEENSTPQRTRVMQYNNALHGEWRDTSLWTCSDKSY